MSMPNFLVIGVAKSGTTSIYNYLNEHPQITMSVPKEPHFFEFGEPEQPPPLEFLPRPQIVETPAEYRALFDALPSNIRRGEASPSNFEARACYRIHQYLPQARFICILRQPVERAYSVFFMRLRSGQEHEKDFRTAYLASIRRLENPPLEFLSSFGSHTAGWYVQRLQDWFRRFPRQQIHIGLYDDLKSNPTGYMRSVFSFLEVDDTFVPNVSCIHNRGFGIRNVPVNLFIQREWLLKRWLRQIVAPTVRRKVGRWLSSHNRVRMPPLNPALRAQLTRFQHNDILQLQDLIGRDLTGWLAE